MTEGSRDEYDRLIAEWLASGRNMSLAQIEPLFVYELILRYYRRCESYYANRRTVSSTLSRIRCALRPVEQLFGREPAGTFGPRSLMRARQEHVNTGLARKTVNDNVQVVKRMFKWLVREEMIQAAVHHGLSAVEGLWSGESPAREPRTVKPVPDADVDAVAAGVLPPVRAMIILHKLTGMRPGEITIMRATDLDMT